MLQIKRTETWGETPIRLCMAKESGACRQSRFYDLPSLLYTYVLQHARAALLKVLVLPLQAESMSAHRPAHVSDS